MKNNSNLSSTDEPRQWFYVSIVDGPKKSLLFGPLYTHEQALACVDPVRNFGNELDRFSHFYGWGTASITTKTEDAQFHLRNGSLNQKLANLVNMPDNSSPVDVANHLIAGTTFAPRGLK